MKGRETDEEEGGARGARPRPAPEESTMENKKDDPFAVFCIVCRKWTDGSTSLEVNVLREGSHADQRHRL